MAQVTIQQILRIGYAAYERSHQLPGYVRTAALALLSCRTAALGGHVQRCPDGHFARIWYNSCKHRFCPQCAWLQIERWLITQKARLFACDHYHVIFTLPEELRGLWLANVTLMTNLFFASVRETLYELLDDPRYLGARPGIIATLHTWSQTLVLHPHVHCLVTGGGMTPEGQWYAVRNGFLLPVRVVMALFRGKLLDAIDRGVRRGTLRLPEGMSLRQWEHLRKKLGRTKWNVHIRERYRYGEGVLTYLARYVRGGPMANTRLVSCDNGTVTFRYRVNGASSGSGRTSWGLMTLPLPQFLQRYLLHVPPPRTRVVRSYGLYAPTQREALARCRAQLGQGAVVSPPQLTWQTACSARGEAHPERCPICGRQLVGFGLIAPSGLPPPGAMSREVAA
jgi:Putative transposase/Transposase zinc-binding domain